MNSRFALFAFGLFTLATSTTAAAQEPTQILPLSSFEGEMSSCEEDDNGIVCFDEKSVYVDDTLLLENKEGWTKRFKIKNPLARGGVIGGLIAGPAGSALGAILSHDSAQAKADAHNKATIARQSGEIVALRQALKESADAFIRNKEALTDCFMTANGGVNVLGNALTTNLATLQTALENNTDIDGSQKAFDKFVEDYVAIASALSANAPHCK